jgi:hypothetical protein
MCQVAGEVADGVRPHPICSAEYVANVMIPEAKKGAAKANRSLEHFKICHKPLVATADTAAQLATRVRDVRGSPSMCRPPAIVPSLSTTGSGSWRAS